MRFVKAHGAGNDFVLVPDLDGSVALTAELTRALCDRHEGLGADGVIRIGPGDDDADAFMDYRNADGSLAEMCGNGVRCVGKYLVDRGLVSGDTVRVGTRGGVKPVEVTGRHPDGRVSAVRVDMGPPRLTGEVSVDVSPLRVARSEHTPAPAPGAAGTAMVTLPLVEVTATTLSMGNPHAVVVVDDVAAAPLATWGPVIAHDEQFPEGANVEFVTAPARDRVVGRIWERGVGETAASGTGACAMAVAAHLRGLAERAVTVVVPGGTLEVDWRADTVLLTGPAVEVASGELDDAWLATRGVT